MEWFIILLIWLVAPFAELAAIIVLAVVNSRYKRRIWELTRGTGKADTGMQLSLIHIFIQMEMSMEQEG